MGDLSTTFEALLEGHLPELRQVFAVAIAEAQARGEMTGAKDSSDVADFLLNSWQGTLLRMKVAKLSRPLDLFSRRSSTVFWFDLEPSLLLQHRVNERFSPRFSSVSSLFLR